MILAKTKDDLPITGIDNTPVNGSAVLTGYFNPDARIYVTFIGNSSTGKHAFVHPETGDIYTWGRLPCKVVLPNPLTNRFNTDSPTHTTFLINRPITHEERYSNMPLGIKLVISVKDDIFTRRVIPLAPITVNNPLYFCLQFELIIL